MGYRLNTNNVIPPHPQKILSEDCVPPTLTERFRLVVDHVSMNHNESKTALVDYANNEKENLWICLCSTLNINHVSQPTMYWIEWSTMKSDLPKDSPPEPSKIWKDAVQVDM